YLPAPPYFVYLYLSQIAVFSGVTFSYGFETNDQDFARFFGLVAILFLGLKLIEIVLDLFINLPKEKQQARYEMLFWIFLLVSMVSVAMNLGNAGDVNPTDFWREMNTAEAKMALLEFLFMISLPLSGLMLVVVTY